MRKAIPKATKVDILVRNQHTCCICKLSHHVQIHHIDSDPTNNILENLAVLCLNCHSRVTGDEGLGQRFTLDEVLKYKQSWEKQCLAGAEDPIETHYEETHLAPESFEERIYSLEKGQEIILELESDMPIDLIITDEREIELYEEGDPDFRSYEMYRNKTALQTSFAAPKRRDYHILIENNDDEDTAEFSLFILIKAN